MNIITEDDVSITESKNIIDERKKERDLVYEQKICHDYLEKVAKISYANLESITEELSKIAILKPRYIALIISMMPDTEEEVDVLFSKERTNLKKEEVSQIVEIVNKYKK